MNLTRSTTLAVLTGLAVLVSNTASLQVFGQEGRVRISDQPANPSPNTALPAATRQGPAYPSPGSVGFAPAAPQHPGVIAPNPYQYSGLRQMIQSGSASSPAPQARPANQRRRFHRSDLIGPEYYLNKVIGSRDGVGEGATNVGVLLPLIYGNNRHLFLDARGVITDEGDAGGSIGLGYRYYNSAYDRLFTLAAFFDHDAGHEEDYQQLGVSFESQGRWLDFRANGYFVVGSDSHTLSEVLTGDTFFTGNQLQAATLRTVESAYQGGDVELGGPLPLIGRYGFSAYAAAYNWDNPDAGDATGVRARINAHVTDGLQIGVSMSDDRLFGRNYWMNVSMSLPDGRARKWFRPRSVRDRMFDRMVRRYRVAADVDVVDGSIPVLVGQAGGVAAPNMAEMPLQIAFIDPQAIGADDGTFEDPFVSLDSYLQLPESDRRDFNIILVSTGDPNDPTAGLDTGITLFDNQSLYSRFIIPTLTLLPNKVDLTFIPAQANRPILSNRSGGAVVTLSGDNTEVAGFIIDGSSDFGVGNSDGIVGANINGFNIHSNIFRNYRNGVSLTNATGSGFFRSNQLIGAPGISLNGLSVMNDGTGVLDLEIDKLPIFGSVGNIATGNDNAAFLIDPGSRSQINLRVRNNRTFSEDTNANGILDFEDVNGNGVLDTEDINLNGVLDNEDSGIAGIPGTAGNGQLDTEDTNGNGFLDPGEDVNNNGLIDFEDTNLNGRIDTEDTNGNGVLDTEDTNLNGRLDTEDTNNNGILDVGNANGLVITQRPTSIVNLTLANNEFGDNRGEDANLNGILDPGEDVNGNGILDQTEDLNGNGVLDLGEDLNGNGVLDLSEDLNGNGVLDRGEDLNNDGVLQTGNGVNILVNNATLDMFTLGEDLNGNGIIDLAEDVNQNGVIDGLSEDRNQNGVLDPGEDINGNGVLDLMVSEDFNNNGLLDAGEDLNNNGVLDLAVSEDLNNNLILDLSITEDLNGDGFLDPGEDLNGNGVLDTNLNEDLNGNGTLDFQLTEDLNLNNVLDDSEDVNANGFLDGGFLMASNIITNNTGDGIIITSTNISNVLVRLVRNTIGDPDDFDSGNGGAGFRLTADSGTVVAAIGFLRNEDLNGNGILDMEVDANGDGIIDPSEDLNGNGILDTEDLNGNGILDVPDVNDGNVFALNLGGGAIVDLTGDAIGMIDVINNTFRLRPASILRSGFNSNTFPSINDGIFDPDGDGLANPVNLGFGGIFYGQFITTAFVNENGNITFGAELPGLNGLNLLSNLSPVVPGLAMIAPFYADADTSLGNPIVFGQEVIGDLNAFGVTYNEVRHFDVANTPLTNGLPTNKYQVVLIDRSDINPGDFDIEFNFDHIRYEAGTAQGADNFGLGGTTARVGITDGIATTFEFPGSAVPGALLDRGPLANSLVRNSFNSPVLGRYVLQARSGMVMVNNLRSPPQTGFAGLRVSVDDDARLLTSTIVNNTFDSNGSHGASFTAAGNGVMENVIIRNNIFSQNGVLDNGHGLNFETTSSTASITSFIENNTFDFNFGSGLSAAAGPGTINLTGIDGNTFTNNGIDGVTLTAVNGGLLNAFLTNNTVQMNARHGISVTADNATVNIGELSDNLITDNGENGVDFFATNNGIINITAFENNKIADNGNNNVNITIFNNGQVIFNSIRSNIFSGPFSSGLSVTANIPAGSGGLVNLGLVEGNDFARQVRGTDGVFMNTRNADIFATFINNSFEGSITGNVTEDANGNGILDAGEDANGNGKLDLGLGAGINVVARGGFLSLNIGQDDPNSSDSDALGNTFNGNAGAAIRMDIGGGTVFDPNVLPIVAQFNIVHNTIENTAQRTEDLNGNGTLEMGEDRNRNAMIDVRGEGIEIIVDGTQTLLTNSLVANNLIQNNGSHGVSFVRNDQARIDFMTIRDNQILTNTEDGISLFAQNGRDDILNFEISGNLIDRNLLYGIDIFAGADSFFEVNIINNMITQNGLNGTGLSGGIRTDESRSIGSVVSPFPSSDTPAISGSWLGNTISENIGPGIEIRGYTTVNIGDGTEAGRNQIVDNRLGGGTDPSGDADGDGVFITGSNNVITMDTNTITGNADDGVDIQMILNHSFFGFISNNQISGNFADGIEISSSASFSTIGTFIDPVLIDNNTITGNEARGIDILNRNLSDMAFSIVNNQISSNGEEGIYVVNTSSPNQTQDMPSRTPLLADGSVLVSGPVILGRISGNLVADNGDLNVDPTTNLNTSIGGLVLRIGTSQFGFMDVEINDNTFRGNFGDSAYFESFTSTVNPRTTTMTLLDPDPLSRLDIVSFRGNTGEFLGATNPGAFYNNADQIKSPAPAVFLVNTRMRNAQRLPTDTTTFRYPALGNGISTFGYPIFIPPVPPGFFPGSGLSTFRVETGADLSGFDNIGFEFDTILPGFPVDTLFINGFVNFPVPIFGEEGYAWDVQTLSPSSVFGP